MAYTQYADTLENDAYNYSLPVGVTKIITNGASLADTKVVMKFGIDDETIAVEEELGVNLSSETKKTLEEKLGIIGLLDAEKTRFKEHLMNKMLTDFDAELTVPQAPITSPLISQMKAGNDLKQKQHEREIQLAKADIEYKKMQVQLRMKELALREHANAIAETQLYMQGQLYDQNERIILQNSTMIKNMANIKSVIAQKEYSLSTDNLNLGDIKLDTAPLVESLNNLTTSNKEVNQKIIEKINADLEKNVEFEGKMYNKTELQNLSNVEKIKNLKDENEFSLNDGLEMVEDFMINDGFSLDFNPFQYLLDEIEKGLKDEFQQIKTQYNINIGSI